MTQLDPARFEKAVEAYFDAEGSTIKGIEAAIRAYVGTEADDDEDMASVGRALMETIEQARTSDEWMKHWSPAQCPTEIVFDLLNRVSDTVTECAKISEEYDGDGMQGGMDCHLGDAYQTRKDIAAMIRKVAP